ncbi:MAG: hypothetical protein WC174_03865, partial [Bacilli bacterium]
MKKPKIVYLGMLVLLLTSCKLNATNNDGDEGEETPTYYKVAFYNDDKTTLLYESKVEEGSSAIYNGTTPTKDSEIEGKYYTFIGWDKSLDNIVVDTNFYATYSENTYQYLCTFNNYDGSFLYSTTVNYGEDVEYFGETPTKKSSDSESYNFIGWDKELTNIKEDTTFTALFAAKKDEYTCTFKNYDETILYTTSVKAGSDVTYVGDTPTRSSDTQYKYTFKGWDKALTDINTDTTFIAQYEQSINTYTCTFYNGDNTILEIYEVEYGKDVTYSGITPTKTDAQYTYTFKGWDKELTNIKEDTNFYPTFDQVVNTFTVKFYLEESLTTLLTTVTDVEYGKEAVYDGVTPTKEEDTNYKYTFSGWSSDVTSVKKNMDVYAIFTKTRTKETQTVTSPTSTKMGYTTVEPISGDTYTTNYTYTAFTDSSDYAYDYLGTLSNKDIYQYYYCQIWEACANLDVNDVDVTTKVMGNDDYYFTDIMFKKYSSFSYSSNFLMGVLEMFRNDNPREFYVQGSFYATNTDIFIVINSDYLLASKRNNYFSQIDTYLGEIDTVTSG